MVKSGGTAERRFYTFARGAQWRNFLDPGILHFGKIGYRLTHHSPTLRRERHSFYADPLLISPLAAPWPDHIKRILSKGIIRLASRPSSWWAIISFLRGWENSFQKNRDVFWNVWEPQYQQANNIFPNDPSTILKKARCRHNPSPKETDRINLFLTCISPVAILFFRFLRPSPYRITKDGSCEEFSRLVEIRGSNRMEKRLKEERRGGN